MMHGISSPYGSIRAPRNTLPRTAAHPAKDEEHEEVAAEVIPIGMAEGRSYKLPPPWRKVAEVQGADDWQVQHSVREEHCQIDQQQQEDTSAGASAPLLHCCAVTAKGRSLDACAPA